MNKRDTPRTLEAGTTIGATIEVKSVDGGFAIIQHHGMSYNLPLDLVRMMARTDQLERDKESHRKRTAYWKDRFEVEKKMHKAAEARMSRFETETRRLTTENAALSHCQQDAYDKSLDIADLLEGRGWMLFTIRMLFAFALLGWALFAFQVFAP